MRTLHSQTTNKSTGIIKRVYVEYSDMFKRNVTKTKYYYSENSEGYYSAAEAMKAKEKKMKSQTPRHARKNNKMLQVMDVVNFLNSDQARVTIAEVVSSEHYECKRLQRTLHGTYVVSAKLSAGKWTDRRYFSTDELDEAVEAYNNL